VDVVFTRQAIGAVEFDARDEDSGKVGRGGGLQEIGGYVEFVVRRKVNAGFVEEGVFGGGRRG